MSKYELTKETKEINNETLYRIKALKDFSDVKAGNLGGWVASDLNLSQDGDCWVYDEARVSEDAELTENSTARDNSWIFGDYVAKGNESFTGFATEFNCPEVV